MAMPGRWLRALLLALATLLASAGVFAQALQPVPALTGHVVDLTGTLDDVQRKGLEDKLMALEQAKGAQLVILIVPTTKPEDDASFANRVGNTWKIGRKGVGDGLLLLVAKDDRRIRIEVAKTLEGAVPDLAAKQVIDEAIRPAFRNGDYAGGLQAGVDQLVARINGEPLPPVPQQPAPTSRGGGDFQYTDLLVFLLFLSPMVGGVLRRIFGRPLGALLAGAGFGAVVWLITASVFFGLLGGLLGLFITLVSSFTGVLPAGMGRGGGRGSGGWGSGGGWSGGSGGGSWGSGGGGDFGGGGASGDW